MRAFLLLLCTLCALATKAQLTINVTTPANTPQGDDIYVAGTFNGWNPADAAFKLTKQAANTYTITLAAQTGTIKFKFTRGSWGTVEGITSGGFRPDREFTFGNGQTINLTVDGWEDKKGSGTSTALPNVKVVSNSFIMPQLGRTRRVLIYLPNKYATDSTTRFPVIYMHDGQNVFDAATAFAGEWGVDETLSDLESKGDKGAIVVAIDNSNERIAEYTPYVNPQYGGGEGDKYVDFIANTLKPYIDSNYRTLPDRENTAIAGSSLGGLISLYAALKHQNVFSKVASFSPAYWINKDSLQMYIAQSGHKPSLRLYTIGGQNESQTLVNNINDVEDALAQVDFESVSTRVVIHVDGAHSEWYWKREFGAAYQWLFANTNTNTAVSIPQELDAKLYPNPANTQLTVELNTQEQATYKIYNTNAKLLLEGQVYKQANIDISTLSPATYTVEIRVNKHKVSKITFVKY